jgi:uncharacterized protein (DUF1330 family)
MSDMNEENKMNERPVAYVISAVEGFEDEATVRRFAELAGPAIEHFGGRFIVSNAEPVVVEGESPSRHLSMVEFPSIEHAKAWYDLPENAEARALTPAAFRGRVLMFVEALRRKGPSGIRTSAGSSSWPRRDDWASYSKAGRDVECVHLRGPGGGLLGVASRAAALGRECAGSGGGGLLGLRGSGLIAMLQSWCRQRLGPRGADGQVVCR